MFELNCDMCGKEIKETDSFSIIEIHYDGSYAEEFICWRCEEIDCTDFWNELEKIGSEI